MSNRTQRTRQRIAFHALQLFGERGFDQVTVTEIASNAGVSHMTVFRYFPTKEDLILSDPFDPLIAASVHAQPITLKPFERARRGLIAAWTAIRDAPELDPETLNIRLKLVSQHSGLRARMWESNHATTQAIAAALQEGGATPLVAEAAAGACLGALTAALLHWGSYPMDSFSVVILSALEALTTEGEA